MLEHHSDYNKLFNQQVENSANYVLPFIHQTKPIVPHIKVLEIGTAEGGVLKPFADKGCKCVGVDLASERIERAKIFLTPEVENGSITYLCKNVYDEDFRNQYTNYFDVIILKDVIEHIPEQEKFIPYLKELLSKSGQIFFGFPPWYMPFGGHQQICMSGFLSKLPYYHIMPKAWYIGLVKWFNEPEGVIKELSEIWDTKITIERFEKIIRKENFKIVNKQWFLINPIYKYKFGLKPRKQIWILGALPFIRNFFTTCVYYTIQK